MLTIAITTFFVLALTGALLIIFMMFHAYQDKITAVLMAGLGVEELQRPEPSPQFRTRMGKPYTASRRSLSRPSPLRAAA